MAKRKKYVMRVYTNGFKACGRMEQVEHRVLWDDVPKKIDMGTIPDNHGFDQSRKIKIVRGKKNVWPLPKSKGNRF